MRRSQLASNATLQAHMDQAKQAFDTASEARNAARQATTTVRTESKELAAQKLQLATKSEALKAQAGEAKMALVSQEEHIQEMEDEMQMQAAQPHDNMHNPNPSLIMQAAQASARAEHDQRAARLAEEAAAVARERQAQANQLVDRSSKELSASVASQQVLIHSPYAPLNHVLPLCPPPIRALPLVCRPRYTPGRAWSLGWRRWSSRYTWAARRNFRLRKGYAQPGNISQPPRRRSQQRYYCLDSCDRAESRLT